MAMLLALGLSSAAQALPGLTGARAPLTTVALGRMNLRDWQEYARQALMPDFARNLGFTVDLEIGLVNRHSDLLKPEFSSTLPSAPAALTFQFASRQGLSLAQVARGGPQRLLDQRVGGFEFERSILASGFRRSLGNESNVDVAAVFAQQGYATPGFGAVTAQSANDFLANTQSIDPRQGEQVSGAGLRLGFDSELSPGVVVGASFRSRIDMDAFQNYRGVYAEPGDFDIPASANFSVLVRAGRRSAISFDIQRVLYSDVSTFTTALLPDRFLSLLGDSASPEFDWDDLTVYELGWSWQSSDKLAWKVSYSTSQQPAPSSPALARALRRDVADRSMSVGMTHNPSKNTTLNLNASYAPAEYYLGNPQFARPTDLNGDSFELELLWSWKF
ncbi:MAG: hypothetical protein AB8B96_18960 [Lysobacterales bacterium]